MENTNQVLEVEKKIKPKLTKINVSFRYALEVWWKNLGQIIKVYLEGIKSALIPLAVMLLVAISKGFMAEKEMSFISQAGLALVVFVAMLFTIYFVGRAFMALYLLLKSDFKGDPQQLYLDTKSLFWPYIGLSLLTSVLILLWTLLLIIPGLVYSIFYSFAVYVFFFEEKKGREALRRSRELVRGYFWPVAGRIFLFAFGFSIFYSILASPLEAMTEGSPAFYLWSGLLEIINFLLGPIVIIFFYSIYKDLKNIKDVKVEAEK